MRRLYIIRACLRQGKGRTAPKTIEKCAFPASKDAGSCCAIREFLQRIVGPSRPAKGFSQISFEGENAVRKSPCANLTARALLAQI